MGQERQGPVGATVVSAGEGMVNFPAYFAMLRQAKFSGPVQLHTEYPLGGVKMAQRH